MMNHFMRTIAAFAILATTDVHAQSNADFFTENGVCTLEELDTLEASDAGPLGRSFTKSASEIFKSRGINPAPTDQSIPPMESVRCHVESGDKVLVSSDGNVSYCGWVAANSLLRARGEKNFLLGGGEICGRVEPMSIADFCETLISLGELTEACLDPSVKNSVFDTKFIVDNTSLGRGELASVDEIEAVKVDIFAEANSTDIIRQVTVFNVLRVFDAEAGPDGGLRYLIGVNGLQLLGWIDANAGTVWYSKLATYFSASSSGEVLNAVPGAKSNQVIAEIPPNLSERIEGTETFQHYPVLLDQRRSDPSDPPGKKPYLEIAFIGGFCVGEGGQICDSQKSTTQPIPTELLNSADTLFLIDGTKSMQTYFGYVANAVEASSEAYFGNLNFTFGVAVYGDFEDRSATALDDPMQFRMEAPLQPILSGDEFSNLPEAELYIADALSDKPEAANAALFRAIKETQWRGPNPKFIIHIADHGDREPPGDAITSALKNQNVFYFPVAVKGEAVLAPSQNFVDHAKLINEKHRTESGFELAIPANVTYTGEETTPEQEYLAIRQALNAALETGAKAQEAYLDLLYSKVESELSPDVSEDASRYPPGYANVPLAALEIFGFNVDEIKLGQSTNLRTIAARGYVETAPVGSAEMNWAYFAAIHPRDLIDLESGFTKACAAMKDGDGYREVTETVRQVISTLTGDTVSEDELSKYFLDKDNIPLSTQTLLGDGILDLLPDLSNPNATEKIVKYQKEFCRTSRLLKLMNANIQLANPVDSNKGGDLVWRDGSGTYTYRKRPTI